MAIALLYRGFLQIARERGVDLESVLCEARLREAELLDPSARLSPEQGLAFGKALFRRLPDPELGLEAAARTELSHLDLLGYIMKHSRDLAAALNAFTRYGRLIGDTAAFTVEYRDDCVLIGLSRTGGRKMLVQASDFAVALIARLLRELSVERATPRAVQLPRPEPRNKAAYARFFGVPVEFGADRGVLVYPSAVLASPMLHSDPALARILSRQADGELTALLPDADLTARVRAQLARDLEQGSADIAAVAHTLGMSERTLRRRLREAGSGFRELLDDVRRERALALAEQAEHGVMAIGIMTGFRDSAAFARAFRRWTGRLPSDYLLERQRATQSSELSADAGSAEAPPAESNALVSA